MAPRRCFGARTSTAVADAPAAGTRSHGTDAAGGLGAEPRARRANTVEGAAQRPGISTAVPPPPQLQPATEDGGHAGGGTGRCPCSGVVPADAWDPGGGTGRCPCSGAVPAAAWDRGIRSLEGGSLGPARVRQTSPRVNPRLLSVSSGNEARGRACSVRHHRAYA
jgi:hypothetical protein